MHDSISNDGKAARQGAFRTLAGQGKVPGRFIENISMPA